MMSIILCYLLLFELKRVMTLHVHVQACTCSIDFEKKGGGGARPKNLDKPRSTCNFPFTIRFLIFTSIIHLVSKKWGTTP